MQPALDALASWAATNEVEIAADKTEALVISSDPNEVNAKCRPRLTLNGLDLVYNPEPKILGVHFDSQLRFGPQARFAVAKLSSRINVLRALAGTDWGCDEDTLRTLYTGYARPGALYAGGRLARLPRPDARTPTRVRELQGGTCHCAGSSRIEQHCNAP